MSTTSPAPSSPALSPLTNSVSGTDDSPDTSALTELSTYATPSAADQIAALKLIADPVAQQRQLASRLIIFYPLFLAGAFGFLALVAQWLLGQAHGTSAIAGGYLELVEKIGCGFMSDNVGKEDTVVVTRYGEVIIGCVVLRVVLGEKEKGRRKIGRRGNVRAWTVGLRWKGKGRREGVRMAMPKKGCDGLGSAQVHANSGRVLLKAFNGGFERREQKARKMLMEVVDAQKAAPGRKR
ncbi:hypothetical protein MMC08_002626 [Hypocenomyce scalaris]|nr:hypothetical protein [Hypocenomyce scalaris]